MTDRIDIKTAELAPVGQRGPQDHERREQIIAAADEHFRHYGYGKTTVADLAKAIGLSTAYIYKFFESKQAIGEAVCRLCMASLIAEASGIAVEPKPAADRLRRIFLSMARRGVELMFSERKLHDLAVVATTEKWQAVRDYEDAIVDMIRGVIISGRESGEFERKTLIDETSKAIKLSMLCFLHPSLIEEDLALVEAEAMAVANLVLRSLAP